MPRSSAKPDNTVKLVRLSLGITQAKFAELLGVSRALVGRWEIDSLQPTPPVQKLINKAIRVGPKKFFKDFA